MAEKSAAELEQLAEQILNDWADKGKIIEGGWQAMVELCGLQHAPAPQIKDMRRAYMLGAQHLFSSIVGMLEPGANITEQDLRRMDLIHQELEGFRRSLHN